MGSKHVCASVLSVADDMMALFYWGTGHRGVYGPAMFSAFAVGASQPRLNVICVA